MMQQDHCQHVVEFYFSKNDRVMTYVANRYRYWADRGRLPGDDRVQQCAGWVCPSCGLTRGSDLIDPCLGRLPGVDYACCGHGGFGDCPGYIKFSNGRVVRFGVAMVDGQRHRINEKSEWFA